MFSKRYRRLRAELAEQEWVMAARRKREHGWTANRILKEFGCHLKSEKNSHRAWKKRWGRRMKATALGLFMGQLRRKAKNASGRLIAFNAGLHRLSQYNHTTEDFVKKPLALHWHVLRDGSGQVVQRDLYSAWLALFVQADGFSAPQEKAAWEGACPLLARAAPDPAQTARGSRPLWQPPPRACLAATERFARESRQR